MREINDRLKSVMWALVTKIRRLPNLSAIVTEHYFLKKNCDTSVISERFNVELRRMKNHH